MSDPTRTAPGESVPPPGDLSNEADAVVTETDLYLYAELPLSGATYSISVFQVRSMAREILRGRKQEQRVRAIPGFNGYDIREEDGEHRRGKVRGWNNAMEKVRLALDADDGGAHD